MFYSVTEKKNCIIDELNKVLVAPEEFSPSQYRTPGLEHQVPLVYLDSDEMDSTENFTELDDYLPVVGENFFLPKEAVDDFMFLPIINVLGSIELLKVSIFNICHNSRK